jgi:hypothetical protein
MSLTLPPRVALLELLNVNLKKKSERRSFQLAPNIDLWFPPHKNSACDGHRPRLFTSQRKLKWIEGWAHIRDSSASKWKFFFWQQSLYAIYRLHPLHKKDREITERIYYKNGVALCNFHLTYVPYPLFSPPVKLKFKKKKKKSTGNILKVHRKFENEPGLNVHLYFCENFHSP